jgi:hypothetical protein
MRRHLDKFNCKNCLTAGPMPFIAAVVHTSFLTRSKIGRIGNVMTNDGKKIAAAAIAAPPNPETL